MVLPIAGHIICRTPPFDVSLKARYYLFRHLKITAFNYLYGLQLRSIGKEKRTERDPFNAAVQCD